MSISVDGRYVAFRSKAYTFVPDDTNDSEDIYVRDMTLGTVVRASVKSDGSQVGQGGDYPAISGNGRFVAFVSFAPKLVPGDNNHEPDVFVHDLETGATIRVSVDSSGAEADRGVNYYVPAISFDGNIVAFASRATNLTPDNGIDDFQVYVRDISAGTTTMVSRNSAGEPSDDSSWRPALSADGRFWRFSASLRIWLR